MASKLFRGYCIECEHQVTIVVPDQLALMPITHHTIINLHYHQLDVCTGPFAFCPPPDEPIDEAFLFSTQPSPEELVEQEAPITLQGLFV